MKILATRHTAVFWASLFCATVIVAFIAIIEAMNNSLHVNDIAMLPILFLMLMALNYIVVRGTEFIFWPYKGAPEYEDRKEEQSFVKYIFGVTILFGTIELLVFTIIE